LQRSPMLTKVEVLVVMMHISSPPACGRGREKRRKVGERLNG
jgi:hypothetical protein